ncbi:hypothetical protein N9204_02010 [bacterium]|nr:hypothetical protein [bacterium]
MFGKRYFAIRERLAEVVLGVGQLARECGGEILDPVTDGSFLKDLRKPFLFVVCGEVNAGKGPNRLHGNLRKKSVVKKLSARSGQLLALLRKMPLKRKRSKMQWQKSRS